MIRDQVVERHSVSSDENLSEIVAVQEFRQNHGPISTIDRTLFYQIA